MKDHEPSGGKKVLKSSILEGLTTKSPTFEGEAGASTLRNIKRSVDAEATRSTVAPTPGSLGPRTA